MTALLRLQLELSRATHRRGDDVFEPLCDVLRRMEQSADTPPELRQAIKTARKNTHDFASCKVPS